MEYGITMIWSEFFIGKQQQSKQGQHKKAVVAVVHCELTMFHSNEEHQLKHGQNKGQNYMVIKGGDTNLFTLYCLIRRVYLNTWPILICTENQTAPILLLLSIDLSVLLVVPSPAISCLWPYCDISHVNWQLIESHGLQDILCVYISKASIIHCCWQYKVQDVFIYMWISFI